MLHIIKRHKKIFTDTVVMLTSDIIDKGLRFLIVMIVVRILDKETYGTYVLLFAAMELIIGFLDFNLFQAVVRFTNMVSDWKSKMSVIVNSFFIEFLIGASSFIVLYVVVVLGRAFGFFPPLEYLWSAAFFMALYVFAFPLMRNGQAIFQATSNFSTLSVNKIIPSLVVLIALLAPLSGVVNVSIPYIMAAYAFSMVCAFVAGVAYLHRSFISKSPEINRLNPLIISPEWLKKLLSFSIYPFIQGCLSILWRRVDLFLLAYFLSKSDVGIFRNGVLLASLINIALSSFGAVAFPKIVSKYSAGDVSSLRRYNELYISAIFIILLPIVSTLSLFSDKIIHRIFTYNYAASSEVFKYAILISPFLVVNSIRVDWVIAMNRQKVLAFAALLVLLTSVSLDIFLIPKYRIAGALISFLASNVLLFIYVSIVSSRITGTRFISGINLATLFIFIGYTLINSKAESLLGVAIYIVISIGIFAIAMRKSNFELKTCS